MDNFSLVVKIEEQNFTIMRCRHRGWKIFWFLISILQLARGEDIDDLHNFTSNENPNQQRSLFSPRMDYEQWKPLGHGDPLKNDPTYDYVPPVLDRVHYWADPNLKLHDAQQHGDSKKTEILLLGVSSKKPANGIPADSRRNPFDPYIKYVENNHFNQNQRIARPSFIPPMNPSLYPSMFQFQNKNKFSDRAPFSKGTEQRIPYTVLMPPPMDQRRAEPPKTIVTPRPLQILPASTFLLTTTSPVTPAVTIEESNLIYQSSSLSDESEFQNTNNNKNFLNNKNVDFDTLAPSVNWELTSTERPHEDYNEKFVFDTDLAPPESFIHIEFSPRNLTNKHLDAADSNHNVNYVTPPSLLINMVMHKGHVSDDDDISNSYVKIGKPEAEVQSTGIEMADVRPASPLKMFPHRHNKPQGYNIDVNKKTPMTMHQALEYMQTMQPPPPVTNSPTVPQTTNSLVLKLLAAERTKILSTTTPEVFSTTNYVASASSKASVNVPTPKFTNSASTSSTSSSSTTTSTSTISTSSSTSTSTTTTAPSTTTKRSTTRRSTTTRRPVITTEQPFTTTMSSLTTDPLFKHYKQPVEPLKGPLYLIIQGHSKVKKYGPKKQMHGISIQETNEISDNVDYVVTHLHGFRDKDPIARKSRNRNLQTLKHVIQTGLGAIDFEDVSEENRRSDDSEDSGRSDDNEEDKRPEDDVQETKLQAGYEVADGKDLTSERYHKGIVEEARKMRH